MKMIIRIMKEVFDFFCGDWRVFRGVALTILLIEGIKHLGVLAAVRPLAGVIFFIGISLSLTSALRREIKG